MGANTPPPPWAEKVRLKRAKDEYAKRKNTKDESFLLVYQRNFSQCRKHTRGCCSLITVFMLLIYLPRPINNRQYNNEERSARGRLLG